MKRSGITPIATITMVIMVAVLCLGCEKEGPAERAGKQFDDAAAEIGGQLEDAGEELTEAVEGKQ